MRRGHRLAGNVDFLSRNRLLGLKRPVPGENEKDCGGGNCGTPNDKARMHRAGLQIRNEKDKPFLYAFVILKRAAAGG
jgi:hypothetical protein